MLEINRIEKEKTLQALEHKRRVLKLTIKLRSLLIAYEGKPIGRKLEDHLKRNLPGCCIKVQTGRNSYLFVDTPSGLSLQILLRNRDSQSSINMKFIESYYPDLRLTDRHIKQTSELAENVSAFVSIWNQHVAALENILSNCRELNLDLFEQIN